MITEGEDGKDYINIYSKGKTEIGRWLSNFAYSPITLKEGDFKSIEGYWYWLSTLNDHLRDLHGYEAKKLGKKSEVLRKLPKEVFQQKIKDAIDVKLKTRLDTLSKVNLPLTHHYVYGGKKVDAGYEWIVDHITKRIEQIKEYKNK